MSGVLSPATVESGGPASDRAGAVDERAARARPIDLVHLARQTFGDKRLETELLRLFMRQAEQIQGNLDGTGAERRDRPPACDLLHMLQGSARVVGAVIVAEIAQQLETQWRQAGASRDDLPEADRARLREAVGRTNRFIAGLLEST